MASRSRTVLRVCAFAVAFLVLVGTVSVQRAKGAEVNAEPEPGFFLETIGDLTYACVGDQYPYIVRTGVAGSANADRKERLARPRVFMMQLTAPPRAGKADPLKWYFLSSAVYPSFPNWLNYTATKAGDELLELKSEIKNSEWAPISKQLSFKVFDCNYKIKLQGEMLNTQGQIMTHVKYNGEGEFAFSLHGKYLDDALNPPWKIEGMGYGDFTATIDGKEGKTLCRTTSPGTERTAFKVKGEATPSGIRISLVIPENHASVNQACIVEGKGEKPNMIPIMWDWNSKSLRDVNMSSKGAEVVAEATQMDYVWPEGENEGTLKVTVTLKGEK